jgi:hypothetical protein
VNDTVREFGGALGVAVIGSIAATGYATAMSDELDSVSGLTDVQHDLLTDNVGAAIHASHQLGAQGEQIASIARQAFVDSMSTSLWIAAGLAFCAAVIALTQLPRHHAHGAGHGGHHAHHAHKDTHSTAAAATVNA